MITYELCLLLRIMPKVLTYCECTTCTRFFKYLSGELENNKLIGHVSEEAQQAETSEHKRPYFTCKNYFLIEFNAPPTCIEKLKDEYMRDVDIIRRRIYKKQEPEQFECTLHEELLPAPYRKSVQKLMAEAKKLEKPRFKYNTGLDYFPFQK